MYVSRKNGGRGLIGCKNSVKSEENGVDSYVKNNIESPIIAVKTRSIITWGERVGLKEFKTIEEPEKMNKLKKECMKNLLEIRWQG